MQIIDHETLSKTKTTTLVAIANGDVVLPPTLDLGVNVVLEDCNLCATPTRTWQINTHTPVCQACAV